MHCNHGWRSLRAPHADTRRGKNKCSDAGNVEKVSSLLQQKKRVEASLDANATVSTALVFIIALHLV